MVTPAVRIAAPISRACFLPRTSRLRWVVQSSRVNFPESAVPGAWAWRTMAPMPGWCCIPRSFVTDFSVYS